MAERMIFFPKRCGACTTECPVASQAVNTADPNNVASFVNVYCDGRIVRAEAFGKENSGHYFSGTAAFTIPVQEV